MFRTLIPTIQHIVRSLDMTKSSSAKKSKASVAPLEPLPEKKSTK